MAASPREIRSLTGLRGIAACYVMLYHFSLDALTGLPRRIVQHGYLSVDLFFVLSGFVMSFTYASRFDHLPNKRSLVDFFRKRFARVYPLYIFVTVLMVIGIRAHLFNAAWPSGWTFSANLFLLQAFGLVASICPPSWSIGTEFVAYLFFPLLAGVMLYRRRRWSWLAMLTCMAIVFVIGGLSPERLHEASQSVARHGPLDIYAPGTLYPLTRCLAEFFMGVAVFRFFRDHSLSGRRWAIATDLLVLVILGLLFFDRSDVVVVLLYPLLVLLLSMEQGLTVRLLSSRVIHWLGLVSYSIYMDHSFLHQFFGDRLKPILAGLNVPHPAVVRGVCLIVVTILVAALTYYSIEKPVRDWFGRKPGKPPGRSIDSSEAAMAAEPSAP
jgi:peptidoglycan/LPS O-acetylase OafA/YrhL